MTLSTGTGGRDGAPELHGGTRAAGAAAERPQQRHHGQEQGHQGPGKRGVASVIVIIFKQGRAVFKKTHKFFK